MINYNDNLLLIISHIPTNQDLINTVKIIPYPDHNGYQLDHTNTLSYFEKDGKVFTSENIEIEDECITSIIQLRKPICNYIPIQSTEIIKYLEPNTIVTWNLTETTLKQNCQNSNNNLQIKGNKIMQIKQCKVEIGNIILSGNYQTPEINLTPLYSPLELTKIKIIRHNDIVQLITENNYTFYFIIAIIILVIILLYIYLKYVTFNPIILLYSKLRSMKTTNVDMSQNSNINQEPLPKLYPSVTE